LKLTVSLRPDRAIVERPLYNMLIRKRTGRKPPQAVGLPATQAGQASQGGTVTEADIPAKRLDRGRTAAFGTLHLIRLCRINRKAAMRNVLSQRQKHFHDHLMH
jgi:hypothetical protein